MTTDALAVMEYLARNDFTAISQVGPCLLLAKDGARSVLIWIENDGPLITVPNAVVDRVQTQKARLDIVCIGETQRGNATLTHIMNALDSM